MWWLGVACVTAAFIWVLWDLHQANVLLSQRVVVQQDIRDEVLVDDTAAQTDSMDAEQSSSQQEGVFEEVANDVQDPVQVALINLMEALLSDQGRQDRKLVLPDQYNARNRLVSPQNLHDVLDVYLRVDWHGIDEEKASPLVQFLLQMMELAVVRRVFSQFTHVVAILPDLPPDLPEPVMLTNELGFRDLGKFKKLLPQLVELMPILDLLTPQDQQAFIDIGTFVEREAATKEAIALMQTLYDPQQNQINEAVSVMRRRRDQTGEYQLKIGEHGHFSFTTGWWVYICQCFYKRDKARRETAKMFANQAASMPQVTDDDVGSAAYPRDATLLLGMQGMALIHDSAGDTANPPSPVEEDTLAQVAQAAWGAQQGSPSAGNGNNARLSTAEAGNDSRAYYLEESPASQPEPAAAPNGQSVESDAEDFFAFE